MVCFKVGLL